MKQHALRAFAVALIGCASNAHGADVLEVFRAASPEERRQMIEFAEEKQINREAFLRHSFTREYIDSLCQMVPGPTRDSEFAIAADEYRIFELKSVVDPVKRELMGDALIDCTSSARLVSGRLDTSVIRDLRKLEKLQQNLTVIDQPPIEVEEPYLVDDAPSSTHPEQAAAPECKPLPRDHNSMCDTVPGAQGCQYRRRTTCDQGADNSKHGDLNDVIRGMGRQP